MSNKRTRENSTLHQGLNHAWFHSIVNAQYGRQAEEMKDIHEVHALVLILDIAWFA